MGNPNKNRQISKNLAKKGMHPGESAWKVWNGYLSCVIISTVVIGHTTKDFEFGSDTKNKKIMKGRWFFWGKKKATTPD